MRAHARTYVRTYVSTQALARARAARVGVGIMAERRPVPSDLFPLVLAFLRESGCQGAARAFAKEAAAVSGEGRDGPGRSGTGVR